MPYTSSPMIIMLSTYSKRRIIPWFERRKNKAESYELVEKLCWEMVELNLENQARGACLRPYSAWQWWLQEIFSRCSTFITKLEYNITKKKKYMKFYKILLRVFIVWYRCMIASLSMLSNTSLSMYVTKQSFVHWSPIRLRSRFFINSKQTIKQNNTLSVRFSLSQYHYKTIRQI